MDYSIINIEQGSPEWKALRRNFVTGTDVSALFGEHLNFRTLYALWENKKSGESIFVSEAMKRGSREETRAMNFLRQKTGIVFSPCVLKSKSLPMLVSLDGMDFDGEYMAEIKVPLNGHESDLWEKALRKQIPKAYMYQIQAGLMLSGAKKCYYFVFDGAFDGVIVEVLPDYALWKEIEARSVEFHARYLKGGEVPDDKKEEIEREDEEFLTIASKYAELDARKKAIDAEMSILKAKLIEMAGDGVTTTGGGIKISFSAKTASADLKGLIRDYLPEIDLDDLPEEYAPKRVGTTVKVEVVKAKQKKPKKAA